MDELGIRRCPFCHDGIAPGQDVVACRDCLAAHHEACWDEAGECSACQCAVALRTGRAVTPAPDAGNALLTLAVASWFPLGIALLAIQADLRGHGGIGRLIEEPVYGNYIFWLPAFALTFTFLPAVLTFGGLAGAEKVLPLLRSRVFLGGLRIAGPASWFLALLGCGYGVWQAIKAESVRVALDAVVIGSAQWVLLGGLAALLSYWLTPTPSSEVSELPPEPPLREIPPHCADRPREKEGGR